MKFKIHRRKQIEIKVEIHEMANKHPRKMSKSKTGSIEKVNKIGKSLRRLIKQRNGNIKLGMTERMSLQILQIL